MATTRSLELAGIRVGGFSVGGIRTCIDLPGHGLCFDLGALESFAVAREVVLLTHAHIDHLGALASHCALRSLCGMRPPTFVVPHEQVEPLTELFAVWRRLDGSDLPHQLVPIGPGEEFELPNRRIAKPFRAPHSAPCQGYALYERRRRLKPEYRGRHGRELASLRERGVEFEDVVDVPEVAFCADTRIEVLDRRPELLRTKLLILECTFLDERVDVAGARSRGHVHLDEIIARADSFENEALLLTHFSARYGDDEVRALLDAKLPASLRERVTPLLSNAAPE